MQIQILRLMNSKISLLWMNYLLHLIITYLTHNKMKSKEMITLKIYSMKLKKFMIVVVKNDHHFFFALGYTPLADCRIYWYCKICCWMNCYYWIYFCSWVRVGSFAGLGKNYVKEFDYFYFVNLTFECGVRVWANILFCFFSLVYLYTYLN